MAPTLAFTPTIVTTGAAGTLTCASFTPLTGDIIVVKLIAEDAVGLVYNTPTGGGWTYTLQVSDLTASHTGCSLWTAVVTTGGTAQTVSSTKNSGTFVDASMIVEVWRNGQLAATPAVVDTRSSGAPTATITTAAAGSVVSWANGDWTANPPTGHTYRTTSATPTEEGVDDQSPSHYVGYYAWQSATTAGAQTLGMTAPGSQTSTIFGIEIQAATGGGSAPSPAQPPPIPPGRMSPAAFRWQAIPPQANAASSAPTPITLTDVAGAADDIGSPAATVPLADPAGAVDALSVAASVPLADVAGSADTVAVTAAVPLADVAGSADQITVPSEGIPVTDVAGAADAVAVTAAVSLADVAGATDAPAVTAAVPLADAAGSIDAQTSGIAIPQADVAGAADTLAATAAVPLADPAGAADALVVTATVPLAELAGAADTVSIAAAVSLADLAGAADAISTVQVTPVPFTDVAGSAESFQIVSAVPLSEVAGAADALAVTASVPLSDLAAGVETSAVVATLGLADVAGAADTSALVISVSYGDVAGALDGLSVSVAAPLADSGAAAEATTASVVLALLDAAGARETILAISSGARTGTVTWIARPERARWRPSAYRARWQLRPSRARWAAVPFHARWTTEPASCRWRIIMTDFDPIAAISPEMINVRWISDLAGTTIDPTVTPLVVQMAFPVSSGNPNAPAQPVTWFTASWLAGGTGKGYVAQCIVGPGTTGPTLVAGQKYDVWSQITGTPESPKKYAGTIGVY